MYNLKLFFFTAEEVKMSPRETNFTELTEIFEYLDNLTVEELGRLFRERLEFEISGSTNPLPDELKKIPLIGFRF